MAKKEPKIEKLAVLHHHLLAKLKAVLFVGHASFIKAGEYLYRIKSKKTYKTEDGYDEITWEEFCNKEDVPLPSRTPEGRRRVADCLIRVYKIFKSQLGYKENEIADIGWTKLDLIATVCEGKGKLTSDEWLGKARALTVRDLKAELGSKDKSLTDLFDCGHLNAHQISLWKCDECGLTSKWDPRVGPARF